MVSGWCVFERALVIDFLLNLKLLIKLEITLTFSFLNKASHLNVTKLHIFLKKMPSFILSVKNGLYYMASYSMFLFFLILQWLVMSEAQKQFCWEVRRGAIHLYSSMWVPKVGYHVQGQSTLHFKSLPQNESSVNS